MTNDTRKRFTLRITHDLSEKIKNEAVKTGHSVNSMILYILENWVKENG